MNVFILHSIFDRLWERRRVIGAGHRDCQPRLSRLSAAAASDSEDGGVCVQVSKKTNMNKHRVENRKVMLHSKLKRPTISTLFQRPSEGVGKSDFRVTAGGGRKKMMAIQTTKGATAATHTP